jgi:competence protein ComEA
LPNRRVGDQVRGAIVTFGWRRLALGCVGALFAAAAGWWLLRAPATPIEQSLPRASTSAAGVATSTPAGSLTVQIAGAVVNPGVYELPFGARVRDLVVAAGGGIEGSDPNALPLATKLIDGQRIYLPKPGETPPAASDAIGPLAPTLVNLNLATAAELDSLPGVGPATAAAIITYRTKVGRIASVDSLMDVPGIGRAKVDALRDLVTV